MRFLTFIFLICFPLATIAMAGGERAPSLFIIGDSTAANGSDRGWGSHLGKYFDAGEMPVINRARGGRSSRTFRSEGLWEQVLAEAMPGDYVLIQFGHNDGGTPGEGKDRGSLRGLGDETVDIHGESVHTFGWYLRQYIADARSKGAIPIVLSPTIRNEWQDRTVERGPGSYSRWSAEVARSSQAAFVDLNSLIAARYERMGREAVAKFFPEDHTHTSAAGADHTARLVAAGLKALPGQPFDHALSAAGVIIAPDAAGERRPFPTPGQLSPNYQPDLPTVFFIGDSTVKNGRDIGSDGLWGWAHPVASHFDRARINVENQALGGMSSRTYRSAGHWNNVLALVRSGDFVVMQFGHNDSSPINDRQRARGTLGGNSDQSREIDNLLTGESETVHTYGWYLRQFIAETKAAGATPVVCSPVPRNAWRDGHIVRAGGSYAAWAREAAEASGAPFIDLGAIVADRYDELGETAVDAFFPSDHTHTGWDGARANAAAFTDAIRAATGCGLLRFLRDPA